MGSNVKAKVVDMEERIRELRTRRMRKEVVECVKDVVGKKKFFVQFEDGHKKDMSYCLLVFLCSNEEIEMDEPKSNLPKK